MPSGCGSADFYTIFGVSNKKYALLCKKEYPTSLHLSVAMRDGNVCLVFLKLHDLQKLFYLNLTFQIIKQPFKAISKW